MSAFEQRQEPPDKNFQYLLFAATPYDNIGFKIPNERVNKERFVTSWRDGVFTCTFFGGGGWGGCGWGCECECGGNNVKFKKVKQENLKFTGLKDLTSFVNGFRLRLGNDLLFPQVAQRV